MLPIAGDHLPISGRETEGTYPTGRVVEAVREHSLAVLKPGHTGVIEDFNVPALLWIFVQRGRPPAVRRLAFCLGEQSFFAEGPS